MPKDQLPTQQEFSGSATSRKPVWLAERRELRLGDVLVKKLDGRARHQLLVLAVFQEEGWPERIDDPIPGNGHRQPARRLRKVVGRLNRCQLQPLLRFRCDGSGQGLTWEIRSRPTP